MPAFLVCIFFFLSGACGLVFENVWSRLLRLVMGNTVFSVTTVLCAFMGGLALGSFLGGKIIDRRKDALKIYALLEGGIGIYCLLIPWLIPVAEPLYRFIYQNFHTSFIFFSLLRFGFSFLILLIPATFMGATFPILGKWFLQREDRIGWTIGKLYALNSFGAVLGAFSSGFILIPSLGVRKTILLASFVNLLVCIGAYVLYRRQPLEEIKPKIPAGERQPVLRFLLIGYGLAGLAALVYEVAWTRVLSLLIGSSVYAFSLMLTAFIFGLAAGSLIYGRFIDRTKDPIFSLALIEMGIGISALAAVPLFGILPVTVVKLVSRFSESFWFLQFTEFGMILAVILIPTLLMGAAFPLITRICTFNFTTAGRSVGNVYAVNTLGSIAGAFCGGFILIPWLGLQRTILAAVGVNLLVGCWFLFFSPLSGRLKKIVIPAALLILSGIAVHFMEPWDPAVISAGGYLYAGQFAQMARDTGAGIEKSMKRSEVIFYKEDVCTTVTVRKSSTGEMVLAVNGKSDASSVGDLPTQTLLAHAPLLFHPNPKSVLVIGLASGVTLGAAGLHPVERLDCVEISPAVVDACRLFDDYNFHILGDRRLNLMLSDGRNHLALTDRTYDVIISEPSNPWIAGIADLFTREFFQLCRRRLNPQGIACIWLQAYDIDEKTFRSIVYTFQTVFPHVTLFETIPMADYLLLGSVKDLQVDYETLRRRIGGGAVARDLQKIDILSPADFLSRIVVNGKGIPEYTGPCPLHTDDNAFAEFSIPQQIYSRAVRGKLLRNLNQKRRIDFSFLAAEDSDRKDVAILKTQTAELSRATGHAILAAIDFETGKRGQAVLEAGKAALLNPRGFPFLNDISNNLTKKALGYMKLGNLSQAESLCLTATELTPTYAPAYSIFGMVLMKQEKWLQAADCFRNALKIEPDNPAIQNNLGWLLATCPDRTVRNGRLALTLAEQACTGDGVENPLYLRTLSAACAETGQFPKAVEIAQKALDLARDAEETNLAESLVRLLKNFREGKPFYQ